MKVNDPNTNGVNAPGPDRTGLGATQQVQNRSRAGAGAAKSSAADSSDSVQISSLSAQLSALSATPPVQAAKLDKLNGDFRTGRLQIDSLAVSQGLIAESLSLGSRSLSR